MIFSFILFCSECVKISSKYKIIKNLEEKKSLFIETRQHTHFVTYTSKVHAGGGGMLSCRCVFIRSEVRGRGVGRGSEKG